ncbi:ABC transporter permease [Methylicorpusculum sp.]|uniref:ABC transporter permease n=1 Tax=Methylicorpusculum sp. TaxID=2713644 RepID=UPI002731BD55|nr:ABC transporter permease [Methylicorpusculum sp.]MDP2177350.1 ABC transporter permease [Methylicorpusculum sp.]MDP3531003.1 ABC transporter permease [Methylicorpusculum sp.]MDZ4151915.1 ABC transporter permease [Methylicorpusculum sp.]
MLFRDTATHALTAIKAQPVRTGLIILAMSIGIASVSILTGLGESARRYIVNEFEGLGTHLLIILPGRTETIGGHPPIMGETPRDLTLEDAYALSKSRYLAAVAPISIGNAPVSVMDKNLEREANIMGSTHALQQVRHLTVRQGQFLPESTQGRSRQVCVIGHKLQQELFPAQSALGQWIRINDRRFRVIGILAQEGQSIGVGFDEIVIVPVEAAQVLFDTSGLFRILAEAKSKAAIAPAMEQIKVIIKARHEGEEDITVITQDSVVATFDKILTALTYTVSGIAAISLSVAGILVMNVMLVSVSQRTAEIGLLKALGATKQQVIALFLTEAVLLSIAGAGVGLILGEVSFLGLARIYPEFPFYLPGWATLAALTVSLVTGLIFGILPARKAANLDPISALAKR